METPIGEITCNDVFERGKVIGCYDMWGRTIIPIENAIFIKAFEYRKKICYKKTLKLNNY